MKYEIKFINTQDDEIWEDDTLAETLSVTASVNEQPKRLENKILSVHPNPFNGIVHVSGTSGFDAYNVAGNKMGSYEANTTGSDFNFSSWPEGVYFIKDKRSNLPPKKVVKVE